jgi:hypothetical protein
LPITPRAITDRAITDWADWAQAAKDAAYEARRRAAAAAGDAPEAAAAAARRAAAEDADVTAWRDAQVPAVTDSVIAV